MKALVVLSGGLDSTVLLWSLLHDGHDLAAISFDYGQRHAARELAAGAAVAAAAGVVRELVHLGDVGKALRGSVLTDHKPPVPDGHYAEPVMRVTVVPNRNAVFLAVAYGQAVASGAAIVAYGAHGGDHAIYPDCRPGFVRALEAAFVEGNAWGPEERGTMPRLLAPFLDQTKADVVRLGAELGAPLGLTWSCYKGGDLHCGTCATCTERREAFALAGVPDRTPYLADPVGAR